MSSETAGQTFAAPGAGTENGAPLPRDAGDIRLRVEQAGYAYAAADRAAPSFTLWPLSMTARRGELVAIVGPNASGKSTALRLLAGVIKPLSGRVHLDGFEISELPARTRAQRVALVQQESALLFPLRVWEYVLQGRYPYGRRLRFESTDDCAMASRAMEQVGAAHLRDRWMEQLSGGEKQRVILARALAQQPLLLLLDEPTQHLDIGGKVELARQLSALASHHRYTVVLVTHELNLAAEFCDQVVLMHRGKCLRAGTPAEVYERELLETVFEAPLEVAYTPGGKPRVTLRGHSDALAGGIADPVDSGAPKTQ
jgi:iron complex transport system ATP-binding protein